VAQIQLSFFLVEEEEEEEEDLFVFNNTILVALSRNATVYIQYNTTDWTDWTKLHGNAVYTY